MQLVATNFQLNSPISWGVFFGLYCRCTKYLNCNTCMQGQISRALTNCDLNHNCMNCIVNVRQNGTVKRKCLRITTVTIFTNVYNQNRPNPKKKIRNRSSSFFSSSFFFFFFFFFLGGGHGG